MSKLINENNQSSAKESLDIEQEMKEGEATVDRIELA